MILDIPVHNKRVLKSCPGNHNVNQKLPEEEKIDTKDWSIPTAPPELTELEVDGVKIKVERVPLMYVPIESIIDEFPDFARETISNIWKIDST